MTYRLDIGYTYYPHPKKASFGGEDAFAVAHNSFSDRYMIAIADGVGSWLDRRGVSAGDFARELTYHADRKFLDTDGEVDSMELAKDSFHATDQIGSTTLILGVLNPEEWGFMADIYYLGDSNFFVFRDGNIIQQPDEQEVEWNRPFQLGKLPGGIIYAQEPKDGERYEFPLEADDILVFATDGLFDNLWEDDILFLLNSMDLMKTTSQDISKVLADAAMERWESSESTPFEESSRAKGYDHTGGKTDDTTVIVIKREMI
jgi:protein phosphatase PTC7